MLAPSGMRRVKEGGRGQDAIVSVEQIMALVDGAAELASIFVQA